MIVNIKKTQKFTNKNEKPNYYNNVPANHYY